MSKIVEVTEKVTRERRAGMEYVGSVPSDCRHVCPLHGGTCFGSACAFAKKDSRTERETVSAEAETGGPWDYEHETIEYTCMYCGGWHPVVYSVTQSWREPHESRADYVQPLPPIEPPSND